LSVTLENGVHVQGTKVNRAIVQRIISQIEKPQPPITHSEKYGDEENPNDPDYIEALAIYHSTVYKVATDTMVKLGAEVMRPLPKNFPDWDSDEWVDKLIETGLRFYRNPDNVKRHGEIDISTDARRAAVWTEIVVIGSCNTSALVQEIMRANGTVEREVMEAAAWLKSYRPRTGDTNAAAAEPDTDRDRDRDKPTRIDTPVRGTRSRATRAR
jgi:hypothetical protein